MGLVIGSVVGCAARPGTVLFFGADNLDAVALVVRGKSRGKFPRRLLSTFLRWCVQQGIEVVVFYLRTNHNIAADEITRLEEAGLSAWGEQKGLTRRHLPQLWEDSRSFIPHLDWGRRRHERTQLELSDDIVEFLKGER